MITVMEGAEQQDVVTEFASSLKNQNLGGCRGFVVLLLALT
jgi:hypothetical protein